MEILYRSTRSNAVASASQAILKGLSEDGGLFVPEKIPALDKTLQELSTMTYQEVAYEVMKLFLTDFTEEELKNCIANAYDSKFDTEVIAPLAEAGGAYYLELFHGKTIAFKDMALSILPHLMITSAKKNHADKDIVVLTATSGDTGKAALAGFADVPGTKIIVFYPKNGVSPIQEKQMVTQKGDNTLVVGIHGNFDDAQTGVKKSFPIRIWKRRWQIRDISSLPPIPSTSDVWYLRLFIMYTHMHSCWQRARLRRARRLMLRCPLVISGISLQPSMRRIWVFPLIN